VPRTAKVSERNYKERTEAVETSLWLQTLISGLTQGSLFALVAVGFNIIYNVAAMPNFAQAEFATIGAFLIFYLAKALHLPIFVLTVLIALLSAMLGVLFLKIIMYPARHLSHMNQVLITIGGMYIFQGAVLAIWGIYPIVSEPFSGAEPIGVLGAKIPTQSLWVIGVTLALSTLLYFFFSRTLIGKALRGVAEKRDIAGIVGINANTMDAVAWGLAAVVGAVGGIIIAPLYPFDYQSGLVVLTMVFCSVIIGGMGNILGGLVGGMIIGMLLAIGAVFFAPFKEIGVFVILLIILSVKPEGLIGGKRA
jgi:branched-chain amino acid transport system permease protein